MSDDDPASTCANEEEAMKFKGTVWNTKQDKAEQKCDGGNNRFWSFCAIL